MLTWLAFLPFLTETDMNDFEVTEHSPLDTSFNTSAWANAVMFCLRIHVLQGLPTTKPAEEQRTG